MLIIHSFILIYRDPAFPHEEAPGDSVEENLPASNKMSVSSWLNWLKLYINSLIGAASIVEGISLSGCVSDCPLGGDREFLNKPNLGLVFRFSTRSDWRFEDGGRSWAEWRRRRWKHLAERPQRRAADGEGGGCGRETGGESVPASETIQHLRSIQPASQTAHQAGQPRRWVYQESPGVNFLCGLQHCLTLMILPPRFSSSVS